MGREVNELDNQSLQIAVSDLTMDNNQSEFNTKIIIAIIPVVLAVAGWAYNIDNRLRDVAARQEERGPRISAMESDMAKIRAEIGKPSARLEDRFDIRLSRLEERINNLHLFILQIGPKLQTYQRRGDLEQPQPLPFRRDYQERGIN